MLNDDEQLLLDTVYDDTSYNGRLNGDNVLCTKEQFGQYLSDFKEQICSKYEDIDPDERQDWFSLSLGWGLAKGMSVDLAHTFSIIVRYDFHYFDVFDVFD